MRVRTILQARTSSSRLPGKALLPVAGMPSALLASRRAARNGGDVVLATSDHPSDDLLADLARDAGIRVVRGSLDGVLHRYAQAAEDLPDDAVVVRLTADNVFPDADFVEELVAALVAGGHTYLGTHSPFDDLPYGLSAEAFRAGALREAARHATAPDEREHVTLWIHRRHGRPLWRPASAPAGLGRLRCTLDGFDDYGRLLDTFRGVDDPIGTPWMELCRRLAEVPGAPAFRVPFRDVGSAPHGTLVLGTVQLGLAYGRTNTLGQPGPAESAGIVHAAIEHGVTHLDTARGYGASEARVGAALAGGWSGRAHVVTKLDPLDELGEDAADGDVVRAVEASVFRSCRELGMRALPTLLLHRAGQRTSHGGRIWARLRGLRDEGVIGALGVSVQTTDEAAGAFADPDVAHVQLPFNVLDGRWKAAGIHRAAAARPDVVVHARSALLQGLLAADDPAPWPRVPGYDPADVVRRLAELAAGLGRESPMELAFACVRAQPWIHGVVVGVASRGQLAENLALFTRPALSPDECARVESAFPDLPDALLNPALWPRD